MNKQLIVILLDLAIIVVLIAFIVTYHFGGFK